MQFTVNELKMIDEAILLASDYLCTAQVDRHDARNFLIELAALNEKVSRLCREKREQELRDADGIPTDGIVTLEDWKGNYRGNPL